MFTFSCPPYELRPGKIGDLLGMLTLFLLSYDWSTIGRMTIVRLAKHILVVLPEHDHYLDFSQVHTMEIQVLSMVVAMLMLVTAVQLQRCGCE